MSGVCLKQDNMETRFAMNRCAREQMKLKLLEDIRFDLTVCEIEGWSKLEYIYDLRNMLNNLGNEVARE